MTQIIKEPEINIEKYQKKAEELKEYEDKLKSYHQEEMINYFRIGSLLEQIKNKKLYFYKDTEGTYSWDLWCREFYGSRRTAERYRKLWLVFIRCYNYKVSELQDIHYSRLALALPLLSSGEAKPKKEVDEWIEKARTAPSDQEFKKMIIQKDMDMEDLSNCVHIIDFYAQCRVCGERKRIKRSDLVNPEEIEKNF